MKYLRENKPIWHALTWVGIYIALVNVGDLIAAEVPAATWATSVLLGCLSVALLVYVKKSDVARLYGVRRPEDRTMRSTLYLLPLFALAFLQYAKGLRPELDAGAIALAVLLVVSVGFIEELLFRGFLFQALLDKGNLNRAIFISGLTFGIGHIVNLARGYTAPDQLIQIVGAVVIGIALAYCVALTRSIIPGVVFHALFNLSGTITNAHVTWDTYIVGAVIVVLVPYIVFLRRRLALVRADSDTVLTTAHAAA